MIEILESVIASDDLAKVAATVASARDEMVPADDNDDPQTLLDQLVHNRAHIERAQAVSAALVLVKAKASRALREAQGAFDDAYAAAALKPSVGFGGDTYTTAKEKDALYGSQAVAEQIALRMAENRFRDVEAVTEFCRQVLRGMEGSHRDMDTRIRLISLRGQLDR